MTMTETTTRLITVSWNITYGKNCFPRDSTSSLYRLWYARRSSWALLISRPSSPRARPDETRLPGRLRLGALLAGGLVGPRRGAHPEAHHEVEVQADQAQDRPRQEQHVH